MEKAIFAYTMAVCVCLQSVVASPQQVSLSSFKSNLDARKLLAVGAGETAHTSTTVGLKLYCSIPSGQNVALSPVSITAGLSMLYLGAKGTTAQELERTVGFPGQPSDENLHVSIGQLSSPHSGQDVTFKSANNLFINPQQPIISYFSSLAQRAYDVTPTIMDFSKNPEGNRIKINDWVSSQTEGEIKDLLPVGTISEATQLVLVNAVFFAAKWATEFPMSKTTTQKFTKSDGQQIQVDMMSREGTFNYGMDKSLGAQVLELPYTERQYSMFVVLPVRGKSLQDIEQQFCSMGESVAQYISRRKTKMSREILEVQLPRFNLQEELSLHSLLPQLGIKALFQQDLADLSGIDGTMNLYVAQAQHKALIKVDESGTRAAAATASGVVLRSRALEFFANRPFMFVIFDNTKKAVLFLGRVNDPTA